MEGYNAFVTKKTIDGSLLNVKNLIIWIFSLGTATCNRLKVPKDTTTKYNKIFENGFHNEGVVIHLFSIVNLIKISLLPHCETIFEYFVVFCCSILVTKYAEFHIINIQSICHMNSTTFGQWEVQSIANIFDKS